MGCPKEGRAVPSSSLVLSILQTFVFLSLVLVVAASSVSAETGEEEEQAGPVTRSSQRIAVAPRPAFILSGPEEESLPSVTNLIHTNGTPAILRDGNQCRNFFDTDLCIEPIQITTLAQAEKDRVQLKYDFQTAISASEAIARPTFSFDWSPNSSYFDASKGLTLGLRSVSEQGDLIQSADIVLTDLYGRASVIKASGLGEAFSTFRISSSEILENASEGIFDVTQVTEIALEFRPSKPNDFQQKGMLEVVTSGVWFVPDLSEEEFEKRKLGKPVITALENSSADTVTLALQEESIHYALFRKKPRELGGIQFEYPYEPTGELNLEEGFSVAFGALYGNVPAFQIVLKDSNGRSATFEIDEITKSLLQHVFYPEQAVLKAPQFDFSRVKKIQLLPNAGQDTLQTIVAFSEIIPLRAHEEFELVSKDVPITFGLSTNIGQALELESVEFVSKNGQVSVSPDRKRLTVTLDSQNETPGDSIQVKACVSPEQCEFYSYAVFKAPKSSEGDSVNSSVQSVVALSTAGEGGGGSSSFAASAPNQCFPITAVDDSWITDILSRAGLFAAAHSHNRDLTPLPLFPFGKRTLTVYGHAVPVRGGVSFSWAGPNVWMTARFSGKLQQLTSHQSGRTSIEVSISYFRQVLYSLGGHEVLEDSGNVTSDFSLENNKTILGLKYFDLIQHFDETELLNGSQYSSSGRDSTVSRQTGGFTTAFSVSDFNRHYGECGIYEGRDGFKHSHSTADYPDIQSYDFKSRSHYLKESGDPIVETSVYTDDQLDSNSSTSGMSIVFRGFDHGRRKSESSVEYKLDKSGSSEDTKNSSVTRTNSVTDYDPEKQRTLNIDIDEAYVEVSSYSVYTLKADNVQHFSPYDFSPTYSRQAFSSEEIDNNGRTLSTAAGYDFSTDNSFDRVVFSRVTDYDNDGLPSHVSITHESAVAKTKRLAFGWRGGYNQDHHGVSRFSTLWTWSIGALNL